MDQFGSLGATMPVVSAGHSKTMPGFTGLNREPPTIHNSEIIKPQVNGLLYFGKNWYGLPVLI